MIGPKTVKGKIILSIVGVLVLVFAITLAALYDTGDIYTLINEPDELDDATWHKWNDRKTKKASYVSETTYDGATDVPYELYDIPFYGEGEEAGGATEEMYKSNKELMKAFDKDTVDEYMKNAATFVDLLFNQSYLTIAYDSDEYIDSLLAFYQDPTYFSDDPSEDEELGMNLEEKASEIAEFYVDNEITCSSRWVTDDSLFFRTYYSYTTRGVCYLTITSGLYENGTLCEPARNLFGFDVNYGEEIPLVMDVGFSACGNTDGLGIFKLTTLKDINEFVTK